MGKADEKQQLTFMSKYCDLLLQSRNVPAAVHFYTEGVKLVRESSPIIKQLRALESKGVHLIDRATCLNHIKLTDKVRVGIIGGMSDILEAQTKVDKVVTL